MEYTTLGATGLAVSQVCLGTWRFGRARGGQVEIPRKSAHAILDAAAERGVNFLDTANGYGTPPGESERIIGEWLTERDREDLVLASKVCLPVGDGPNDRGLSRKHVRAQLAGTLDRLGTDYLDLYYLHRWDDETPIAETLSTLDDLVREGRANHIGLSTVAAWKLTKALYESDLGGFERITVTQPPFDATLANAAHYGGFDLEPYLDVCDDQGLAVCPYSPLAAGFLTGKYARDGESPGGTRATVESGFDERYATDAAWDVLDAVRAVADELGATPAQVAIRWLIEQERFAAVVPVVGARTVDQLAENAGAADISLSFDQRERITAARTADETGHGNGD